MAITATYTVTLSASDKDHARGEYVYASIVRTSPATLVPEGLYVQSATINMAGTTFWSGSGYNPYLDFGDIGRVFVSTSVTDKTAIRGEAAIKAATLAGTKVVENVGLMISTISFVN